MQEIIFSVEEAPEGGYTARALGAAIFTEADDMEGLREAVRDAARCHFGYSEVEISPEQDPETFARPASF
jgi:hypothetical protein